MQTLFNTFDSIGLALSFLRDSVYFVIDLVGYIPAIVASGVIVFIIGYAVRFILLK